MSRLIKKRENKIHNSTWSSIKQTAALSVFSSFLMSSFSVLNFSPFSVSVLTCRRLHACRYGTVLIYPQLSMSTAAPPTSSSCCSSYLLPVMYWCSIYFVFYNDFGIGIYVIICGNSAIHQLLTIHYFVLFES